MEELNANVQGVDHRINETYAQMTVREEASIIGAVAAIKQHGTLYNSQKGKAHCCLFNKNSNLVFKIYESGFTIYLNAFSMPFYIDIEIVPPEFQAEIIDLNCNTGP
jgi:hypothetical protein